MKKVCQAWSVWEIKPNQDIQAYEKVCSEETSVDVSYTGNTVEDAEVYCSQGSILNASFWTP